MMETRVIDVTGVGSELQGVGRLEDGRAVFVPGAIPGERVEIHIEAEKGRFCEASLIRVEEASPDRVAPDCPYYGDCGGCQGRHMTYARTLELKRRVVLDALTRIGGLAAPEVRPTLGCADPKRCRNKAEYPIARQDGYVVIGAHARGSRRVVPLTDCLLQTDQSVEALNWLARQLDGLPFADRLKYLVTRVNRAGQAMLVLCGDAPIADPLRALAPVPACVRSVWYCQLNRRPTHALDGRCTRLWGDATLRDRLFDLEFELSPQAFFQVNPPQTEVLYAEALKAAGVTPNSRLRVLDAYCGAGTISLAAARRGAEVTGIEIVPPAIENAKANARLNGIPNARFICADAAREIPRLLGRGQRFDAAILDPPRKGADAALLQALAQAKIHTLAYVSCNPATLARDLKLLSPSYTLQYAQPVDMFPWTGHVETVCLLTHKG